MNVYLGHLSNSLNGPALSATLRSILDEARDTGKSPSCRLPERTLAMRLPVETVEWLRHQAETRDCSMAEIVRAYVAEQVITDLTALYQQNAASPAEFSTALWSALGYEPNGCLSSASSPGEEVCGVT